MYGERYLRICAVFLSIGSTSVVPATAQDQLIQLGWCRDDGLAGGVATATISRGRCDLTAARNAAAAAAIAAARNQAARECPSPVNAANARTRCRQGGSTFAPGVTLNGDVQRTAGRTPAERDAMELAKVGNRGACVFSRVTGDREITNPADRSCGWFIFRGPRRIVSASAQSSCGVICR